MEPSLELVLYRRYVGTVQRTLNTKDGLRLDDYCRVIGVRHDEENDLLFEVTSVHGPTAQSLIQSGSIIARRVCGELNATLAAAFQKHAADTAVMLNINHSEEELGYSLVVEYGRLLAGEISSAVASLAQAYTRKWTHQAEAEAGERRRALAAAKELIKELDEAQTVAIELVTLEHELKELMRATKDLGYRGTHPRFRGVKPVVLAERTAKLQTEVAKKRKKLERNSVYKSRLASVLNDLGSSSQQPAELSASVLKLVKSVRVELMRDESRASVLTDQAVKTLSQHEAISERVRIVAAGLRSEPWHNMLSSYLSEITEHVLPLRGHPVGAIRAKLDALPGSSILGATLEELKQYLSEHECADFASSMKREMAATLEHAAQASETGLYSDCVLCQDALCQDALANVPHDSATIGTFNALCNWHHGVCGAGGGKSCWVANGATRVVRLHAVAFQPLPIFMWFGLEDDACLADVKTAFRRLSRVHHPDKGGSIVEWELTRLCHQLVPDERTLTGYVEKRNHDHFVDTSLGLVDQSVVDRREQLADMQVARQAAQEDARKTSKSKTAQGTASRSEAIWEQGADGAGAEAVRARKRSHQPRALHDQDSEIVRMPKCSVTLDRRLERGKAALIIIWAQKMGERLLYESGGVYVLEYQRTWGVNGKTEWVEVYRGRGLRMCHEVIDDDDTYVSEHNYRCSAVTTEWQSLPSDIFTYSIDLHGNNLPQHVTEAQGQQRFERYLGTTVKLLEASCRGTLSNDDLAKLVRRIDNIARDSSRIGPSWMTRLATAGGLDAEGGTVLARTAAAQRALLEQRNTSERRELAHRTAKVEWRTRIDHAMRMCSTADGAKAAAASMKEWEDELDAFVGRFAVAEEGVPKGSGLDPHQKQLRAMLMNLTRQKRDEAATKARTLEGIERAAKHVQGVTKTRVPSTSASAPGATPAVSAAPQQDGDAADAALLAHVMERVIILSDVGRGLSHLNSIGVVHRDIKPDNILLQRIGLGPQAGLLARIGDFGTARALEAEAQCTGSTTMMTRTRTWHAAQAQGTQVYMAPEYLKSAACSNKVDSFAFGLTIVVTLTGLRAEQRVPKGGGASGGHAGGDEHANLLEYFYDELEDEPAAFVRRLDNAGANGDAGAWDDLLDTVSTLHEIASNCLEPKVKKRPEMRELAPELERARADAEARPVVPSEFCCPLSLEVMKDPVVAADGVTYERAQIERWLLEHDTSPASGVALAHKHITPNLALRDMILRSVAR